MKRFSSNSVLYLSDLVFRKEDDFYIVLNSEAPNIMVVDEAGKRLFELCDGKSTVSEIMRRLRSEDQFKGTTEEEIIQFISSLVKGGFLKTSPPKETHETVERNSTFVQCYLHLTHRCNLRCKHCHVSAGASYEKEMSDERILTLINELSEMKLQGLIITGGEPLLRKKLLYQVIEKARNSEIQQVNVETNGTTITDEDALFLKKHNVKVGVSLDGAAPQSNDFIRGDGAFEKTIVGIKRLVKAGVYTNIGMVLTKQNLTEAEAMVRLAAKLGVNQVTLNTIAMKGRAKQHPELEVPLKNVVPIVKKAWKIAKKFGIRTNVDEFVSQLKEGGKKISCGAGLNILSIDANGDVYPCNFFIGGPLKAGNVYNQSLQEVLENSPLIQEFRNLTVLDTECHDCELRFICAGCPAESFEYYGDVKKRTPWCFLRKEIIWDVITELAYKLAREP